MRPRPGIETLGNLGSVTKTLSNKHSTMQRSVPEEYISQAPGQHITQAITAP